MRRNGHEYRVTMTGSYDGRPCAQVLTPLSGEGSVRVTEPGEYRFHFWRPDGENLDRSVSVTR